MYSYMDSSFFYLQDHPTGIISGFLPAPGYVSKQLGAYFSTSSYHLSVAVLLRYSISSISSYGRRFWISCSFVAIQHVIRGYGLRVSQLETEMELDLSGG